MVCPNCHQAKTDVVNSRAKKNTSAVWRRRLCPQCGSLFTTHEKIDMASLYTVSNGKKPVAFNPARLLLSLLDVLAYTGHAPEDAYWLSETIQEKLIAIQVNNSVILRTAVVTVARDTLLAYDELAGRAYQAKHPL